MECIYLCHFSVLNLSKTFITSVNGGPRYILDLNLVSTVPADVPAPDGARTSAGTVLTEK